MKSNTSKSFLALILAVIFWGIAYPTVANVLDSGMAVGTLNIFRFGSAAIFLLPFFFKDLKHATKKEFMLSLLCGILLFGGFLFVTLALGQEESSPGLSALIVGMGIFIVPLFSFLFYKKIPSIIVVLGILISFIGIFLFSYTGSFVFELNLSTLYSLLSAIFFGIHIFVLASFTKDKNERAITIIQLLVVFVLFVLYVLIFKPSTLSFIFSLGTWLQVLFLGIFGSGLAYFFQTYASKHLSANICNILLSLESFFAILFSIILGLENITLYYILGAIFMIIGTLMVIIKENKN